MLETITGSNWKSLRLTRLGVLCGQRGHSCLGLSVPLSVLPVLKLRPRGFTSEATEGDEVKSDLANAPDEHLIATIDGLNAPRTRDLRPDHTIPRHRAFDSDSCEVLFCSSRCSTHSMIGLLKLLPQTWLPTLTLNHSAAPSFKFSFPINLSWVYAPDLTVSSVVHLNLYTGANDCTCECQGECPPVASEIIFAVFARHFLVRTAHSDSEKCTFIG